MRSHEKSAQAERYPGRAMSRALPLISQEDYTMTDYILCLGVYTYIFMIFAAVPLLIITMAGRFGDTERHKRG